MKRALLLFMALSTFVLSAQNIDTKKRGNWEKSKSDFTLEQRAELRSKQMTLNLDLDNSQQVKLKELFLKTGEKSFKKGENKSEMTSDEKFEFRNEMLNKRIAMKKELKNILSEDQFQKWENSKNKKYHHPRKRTDREFKNNR